MVGFDEMIKNHFDLIATGVGELLAPVVLVFAIITNCLILAQNKWTTLYYDGPRSPL